MKRFYNPIANLTKFEWALWLSSVTVVALAFFLGGRMGVISFIASLLGVTALIFVAKGDVTGQFILVFFALLYAWVSWEERYYGEMLTYVGMSAPAAILAIVSWVRHPFKEDGSEVEINRIRGKEYVFLCFLTLVVTAIFYFLLKILGTAQLLVSTVSVTTSFFAAYLTFRRSPYYALAYGVNDVVLIVLWMLSALRDPSYFSMVACFVMFLFNDLYGFFNWLRMQKRQAGDR
ncbi:MAG: nicotinamide mononucleotide transporter [Clostridia bacterium]|nr:nicotinamide mononucleotide transporter [Clostridia bacterium]